MLAPDIQSQFTDLLNRLVLVNGETAVGQLSLRHFLFLDVLLVEVPETETCIKTFAKFGLTIHFGANQKA